MQVLACICRLRLQRHSNFLSLACLVGFLFLSYFQFTRYKHTSYNEHKWDFPILGCCLSSRGGVMWWDHLRSLPSLPQLSGCLWREGASGLPSQRLSLEQKLYCWLLLACSTHALQYLWRAVIFSVSGCLLWLYPSICYAPPPVSLNGIEVQDWRKKRQSHDYEKRLPNGMSCCVVTRSLLPLLFSGLGIARWERGESPAL